MLKIWFLTDKNRGQIKPLFPFLFHYSPIYGYPNMLNRMSYIWHIYTCSFHYGKQIFPLLSSGRFPEMPYLWLIWLIYPILYWYSADWPLLICLSTKHGKRKFRQASHCVLLTMRSFVLLVFFPPGLFTFWSEFNILFFKKNMLASTNLISSHFKRS